MTGEGQDPAPVLLSRTRLTHPGCGAFLPGRREKHRRSQLQDLGGGWHSQLPPCVRNTKTSTLISDDSKCQYKLALNTAHSWNLVKCPFLWPKKRLNLGNFTWPNPTWTRNVYSAFMDRLT